jgi:glycosyltransferase involved in cell wall biosynthesis
MTESISVIIPNLNHGSLIGETIDSLAAQTYREFEIIVVDDDPTDLTRCVVDDRRRQYPGLPIRYLHPDGEPQGTHRALNIGIAAMAGEYFAWVSSDEICREDKLANLLEASRAEQADFVFSGFADIDRDGNVIETVSYEYLKKPLCHELLFNNLINSNTVLVHRRLFRKTGVFLEFDPANNDYWFAADYYKWLELARCGSIACVNRPLNHRRRDSTLFANASNITPALYRFYIRRFFSEHPPVDVFQGATTDGSRLNQLLIFLKHGMMAEVVELVREHDHGGSLADMVRRFADSRDLLALALFDYHRRRYLNAFKLLRRAHELFPDEFLDYHAALCHFHLGDHAAAATIFDRLATARDYFFTNERRHYVNLPFYRGAIHQAEGEREAAIAGYRRCLNLNPRHRLAREGLMRLGAQ